MYEANKSFVNSFASEFWGAVGTNSDDELDFDEFKFAIFAFAATNVRVILFTYDGNEDGQLSGNEVDARS